MKHIIIALLSAGFVFLQADAQDTAVLKKKTLPPGATLR